MHHDHDHRDENRTDAEEWDAVYRRDGDDVPLFSGRPNGTMMVEVATLEPGTVLDVGCGEGADAIWLAEQGWVVTALDPSRVAIERARAAARAAGVDVHWRTAELLDEPLGTFDLVSAQYPALRDRDDDGAIHALFDAVAPGGTLLVVHHDLDAEPLADPDDDHDHQHDHDPDDYVLPFDVAAALDDTWIVDAYETRPRPAPLPDGARHVADVVLRTRRRT